MTLEQLPTGQRGVIARVVAEDTLRTRMFALGLRVGREVAVIRRGWLQGPLQVRVGSTELLIRRREARLIELTAGTAPGGSQSPPV